LALVKSKILDQLSDNYPNFIKKDLSQLVEIILSKIQYALIKNERVELRDIFTLETKIQKRRISRNPKTNEKIEVGEKTSIKFKMSKKWFNDLNNNE
jgi:integration host factor subunit beta